MTRKEGGRVQRIMSGLQIIPWSMSCWEGTYVKSVLVYDWIEVLIPAVPPTSQICSECSRHAGLKHPHQLLFPTKMEEWINMKKPSVRKRHFYMFSKQWSISLVSRTSTENIFCLSKLPLPTKLEAFKPVIWDRCLTISTADEQLH